MTTEDKIIDRIQAVFKDYQDYAKFFDKEREEVEKKKKEIAKSLEKGKSFEEFQEEMEFLMFGYQIKMQDVRSIVQDLVALYSLTSTLDIKDKLDEDLIEKVEKLKESKRKLTFVPTEDGLEERINGTQEKAINEIKESPQYDAIMKMLSDNLKG
jgi:signal recognition particle GTPase